MICNLCGSNAATIHLTEIVKNQMVEIHLCEACSEEKGTAFSTHFQMADLLAGLTEPDLAAGEKSRKPEKLVCASCGMTYEGFTKCGRLGCGECYTAFAKQLLPLIKRVQRSAQHLGKQPAKISPETRSRYDLKLLQERLRKSVQKEDFESAASIRDQIKAIQEKSKKPKKG